MGIIVPYGIIAAETGRLRRYIFKPRYKPAGAGMAKEQIAEKIFNALSKGPSSMNGLSRKTGLNPRTLRRYISFIAMVQKKEPIVAERRGFRVIITKGNPPRRGA